MTWSKFLSVQVPKLDNEHGQILSVLDDLYNAGQRRSGRAIVERIFRDLMHYIEKHFQDEEAHMQRIGFPELESHRSEHERFTKEIARYQSDFIANKPVVLINVFNSIWNWLAMHVVVVDKRYADFVTDRKLPL
jgi:hemerythrin